MRVKIDSSGIGFLTLAGMGLLVYILINIDPNKASIFNFSLFYLSFFIAVSGLFILSGYGIRKSIIKNKALSILFKKSFKQGILISIILTGLLLFQRGW